MTVGGVLATMQHVRSQLASWRCHRAHWALLGMHCSTGGARTASASIGGDLKALLAGEALVGVAWAAGNAIWDVALLDLLHKWSHFATALCRVKPAQLSRDTHWCRSSTLQLSVDHLAQFPATCAARISPSSISG